MPLRVARARLTARPGRAVLVALGVAAATALLVAVVGGGAVAEERGVAHALEGVPTASRAFTLSTGSAGPEEGGYAALDRAARRPLATLGGGRPARVMLLREVALQGQVVRLAAVEDLTTWVRIEQGRAPRGCTPARCEVIEIGASGRRVGREPGIELVRVGRGALTSAVPFGGAFRPQSPGDPPRPFLLAADIEALSSLPALGSVYRSYGWILPIAPEAVRSWEMDDLRRREAAVEAALGGEAPFDLRAPDEALDVAARAGRAAGSRIVLVGAGVAVLLLGFALLAAAGLRTDLRGEWRRLERRGARRPQLVLLAVAETAAVTLAGVALGAAAGLAVVAAIARAAGLDALEIVRHSVGSPAGLLLLALAWTLATALLLAALAAPEGDGRRRRGPRPVDLVALGALGAVLLAASRGRADAAALGSEIDPLLPALPVLVALVAAIVIVRSTEPALRASERLTRRGPVALRLALVTVARRPARSAATIAFLAVSLGVAFFAESYRSTLERGQRDQAAFAVPLDLTVAAEPGAPGPLDLASLDRYRALAPAVTAVPVLRARASLGRGGATPVLALPAGAVERLDGWRPDFASDEPGELGRRLRPSFDVTPRGPTLPPGAHRVTLRARAEGIPVSLVLVLRTATGAGLRLPLGTARERPALLGADLPPAARGAAVAGLRLIAPASARASRAHQEAEGGTGFAALPTELTIGPLRAGDTPVTDWRGFVGRGGARPAPAGDGLAVRARLAGAEETQIRPRQPTDDRALPVLVSEDVARRVGGALVLSFAGRRLPARVVASARRFPGAGDSFVVVDAQALGTALDADVPGSGRPRELWLAAAEPEQLARVERALRSPPFERLEVTSRHAVEDDLRADPLARGILLVLAGAALLALVLAGVGLLLATAGDLRDDRAELYDLEAQGVAPATLRAQLQLRTLLVTAAGVLGGLVVGTVLAASVTDLVLLSAGSTLPVPPLVADVPWLRVAAGVLGYGALAAVLVGLVTRSAFREAAPRRAAGLSP